MKELYNDFRGITCLRNGKVMYSTGGIISANAKQEAIDLVKFVQSQFQFEYVKLCKWEYEISRHNLQTHESDLVEKAEHIIDEEAHIKKSYKWVTGKEMEVSK